MVDAGKYKGTDLDGDRGIVDLTLRICFVSKHSTENKKRERRKFWCQLNCGLVCLSMNVSLYLLKESVF